MFRLSAFSAFMLIVTAAPAAAEPLSFGNINGSADLSRSPDLADCRTTTDGLRRCGLARRSFGGIDILASEALLNETGQVRSLRIELSRADHDLARQMLAGRYGAPDKGSEWTRFDDGGRLSIARRADATIIGLDFPKNAAAVDSGQPPVAWPLIAMLGLGLVLGWLMLRWWQRRPARLHPQPASAGQAPLSMRDTLERRLQEGREIRF